MTRPFTPAPPNTPRQPARLRTVLAIAALAAVLTVGFALYAARPSTNASTAASPAAAQAGAAVPASAAGTFTARTLDGASVDIPGSRPSVLFFYSVECGACGPGTRSLAEAQKAIGAKANFVAVDVNPGDTDVDISSFLHDNQARGLALVRDTDARLLQTYQVNQLSTAVILDAAGQVVTRAVDPTSGEIQAQLAKVTTS